MCDNNFKKNIIINISIDSIKLIKKGVDIMKYEKAKKIVIKDFGELGINVDFGRKFAIYPRLRKQMKLWAKVIEEVGL